MSGPRPGDRVSWRSGAAPMGTIGRMVSTGIVDQAAGEFVRVLAHYGTGTERRRCASGRFWLRADDVRVLKGPGP